MRTNLFHFLLITLIVLSCSPKNKKEVADILKIKEPKEWILVIHPEGCKTCLESLYAELENLPATSPGGIVVIAKNSKDLRLHPLFETSPIPLVLDENKTLIEHGLVRPEDQILLLRNDGVQRFDILNYQEALPELGVMKKNFLN